MIDGQVTGAVGSMGRNVMMVNYPLRTMMTNSGIVMIAMPFDLHPNNNVKRCQKSVEIERKSIII